MISTEDLSVSDNPSAGDIRLYSRTVSTDDLTAVDEAELAERVRLHRALARVRPRKRPVIGMADRSVDVRGRRYPTTLIQIVTDDMPCLVDTVTDELARNGICVRQALHPIVLVRRDDGGTLTEEFAGADVERPPDGAIAESWMSIEIDRVADPSLLDLIGKRLESVLDDVREVARTNSAMRDIAMTVAADLADQDVAALLRWLVHGNFMFLGYRLDGDTTADDAEALGLLRQDSTLTAGLDAIDSNRHLPALRMTLASGHSTVRGPDVPFYIGVRVLRSDGQVCAVHRFVGSFTIAARHDNILTIPVISERVLEAISQAGVPLGSHSGQRILEVIQDLPCVELFSADHEFLHRVATGVVASTERKLPQLFIRPDPNGRFYSCVVYLARDWLTAASRSAIQEILLRELKGTFVECAYARAGNTALATMHYLVHSAPGRQATFDLDRIREQLSVAVRSWDDQLMEVMLAEQYNGGAEFRRWHAGAFPAAYKNDFSADVALSDLRRLLVLVEGEDPDLSVYIPDRAKAEEVRFKLYISGRRVTLSSVLPVLQQMGVEVVDQRSYHISWDDTQRWIFDFGLESKDPDVWRDRAACSRFEDAFAAVWCGNAEADRFNTLVLSAGLNWQQTTILRAYAKYLHQIGTPYSQVYIQDTLLDHPSIACALVRLFESRFVPKLSDRDRQSRMAEIDAEICCLIDAVVSLDADRILHAYLGLIRATVRTNYYRLGWSTRVEPGARTLSLKMKAENISDLPQPRPHSEIFVYSPRLEGVHLRFGQVARGGLRWSDRRDDYRTEILGLAKAQAAKNAVIVPAGAKGGFVVKRSPLALENREADGAACYRMFVSALLDVTDNMVDGRIVPPPQVVRHDDDDPYLVVAADKGTATFSDSANDLAKAHRFWLGDAFASGGSVGYDHKAIGITARGAWESVRRHFCELGLNVEEDEFSVVGIGDMSGDVFGNGMLLSENIRLIAAFDHRHIFVDPDPDPMYSFVERQRLFALADSSWDDYDRRKISRGGGVWSRAGKSIPVSERMRAALGLDQASDHLSPTELVRAILMAPVDLLWNGGIGTYVKATHETHTEAQDKGNDMVRVNGGDLRVRVVAEGGNLGLTQRGRIEFASAGGRVNTDAVDNSAGVDCSDHEVNIKILMADLISDGTLSRAERDEQLTGLTGQVTEMVLANNRRQNRVLGVSRSHVSGMVSVHSRLITDLERRHDLDRRLETLPSQREFAALERDGKGLTSPELATLLAHVKLAFKHDVLAEKLLVDAVFSRRVTEYFPARVRERYLSAVQKHPLRREIEATFLVNEVVDNGGLTYAFRLSEEMSVVPADVVRAFAVVTAVYDLHSLWQWIDTSGDLLPLRVTVGDNLVVQSQRLLDRASRWLLSHRPQPLDVDTEIGRFRPVVRSLKAEIPSLVRGPARGAIEDVVQGLAADGVPLRLAWSVGCLLAADRLLDIAEVAESAGRDPRQVAELYFALSERLDVDQLARAVDALDGRDRWRSLARLTLRDDLYDSLREMTLQVLRRTESEDSVEAKIASWEYAAAPRLARAQGTLGAIRDSGCTDLSALSVAVDQIRGLTG